MSPPQTRASLLLLLLLLLLLMLMLLLMVRGRCSGPAVPRRRGTRRI